MSDPGESRNIEQRLLALEEWMMHTDHLLKNLNDVVCAVQDRMDEQNRMLAVLKEAVARKADMDDEERDLEDERPPHY